jgi:hypothetical protein
MSSEQFVLEAPENKQSHLDGRIHMAPFDILTGNEQLLSGKTDLYLLFAQESFQENGRPKVKHDTGSQTLR